MELKTVLSCGDKAWHFDGNFAVELTVGQVRVTYTHSPGCSNWEYRGRTIVNGGENYAHMSAAQSETYMCAETGIGSGSLYTLDVSLFLTKEACLAANAERVMANKVRAEQAAAAERERLLGEETYLREKLAHIEAIKASSEK